MSHPRLFLWTGPKHGGKTTAAARLARVVRQHGFCVAGLLAPSLYCEGRLTGFDALDLRRGIRAPLAVRREEPGDVGHFHFLAEGLRLGRQALDPAVTEGADLVMVDEFGPLELEFRGWRTAVDSLVHAGRPPLVLVVRQELVDAVRAVYASVASRVLDATARDCVDVVLRLLEAV